MLPSGTRARDNEALARTRNGWVNTYGEDEIMEIFEFAGFVCRRRDSWESQRIFVLHKSIEKVPIVGAKHADRSEEGT